MGFLDKPRRLWWRKAVFQIHLLASLVLCLYVRDATHTTTSRGFEPRNRPPCEFHEQTEARFDIPLTVSVRYH